MGPPSARIAVAALFVCACEGKPRPATPADLSGHAAFVFNESSRDVVVVDSQSQVSIQLDDGVPVYLAVFEDTLEQLMIPAGTVADPTGDRGIPPLRSAFVATLEDQEWRSVDVHDLRALFGERRFPAFDFNACAARGGCLERAAEHNARICVPCAPTAPEPPRVPVFSACPQGWDRASVDGVEFCRANIPVRATCPSESVQRFGETGCTPISNACPQDGMRDDVPVGARVLLQGDSIQAAIDEGPADQTLVLGPGTYEPFEAHANVTVIGQCAEETIIRSIDTRGAVQVAAGTVTLRDLRIEGPLRALIASSTVVVRDVHAMTTNPDGIAVVVRDASFSGERFVVSGGAAGLDVFDSSLSLRDAVLSADGVAVVLADAATVSMDRVVMRGILEGRPQWGLSIARGSLDARDLHVESVRDMAVRGLEGARLSMVRLSFADVGTGIVLFHSTMTATVVAGRDTSLRAVNLVHSHLMLHQAHFLSPDALGVRTNFARVRGSEIVVEAMSDAFDLIASTLDVSDVVVLSLPSANLPLIHVGVAQVDGSQTYLARAYLSGFRSGLLANCVRDCIQPCGTRANVRDVHITHALGAAVDGDCLELDAERVHVRDVGEHGVSLHRSSFKGTDLLIDGVLGDPGVGLDIDYESLLALDRFEFRNLAQAGLSVRNIRDRIPAVVMLRNGTIADVPHGTRTELINLEPWTLMDRVQYQNVTYPLP